jgi:hypothetical protein
MTEKRLIARDSKRDLAAELLQAVREMKAGKPARVHHIKVPEIVEARTRTGLSQQNSLQCSASPRARSRAGNKADASQRAPHAHLLKLRGGGRRCYASSLLISSSPCRSDATELLIIDGDKRLQEIFGASLPISLGIVSQRQLGLNAFPFRAPWHLVTLPNI